MANKNSPSKNNNTNSAEWFKNVAKSLGYSLTDVGRNTMPATFDTIETNTEFVKDTIAKVRSLRGNKGTIASMITGMPAKHLANIKTGWSNVKSQAKSGKFYSGAQSLYNNDDLDEFTDISFDDDLSDDSFEVSFDDDESNDTKQPVNVKVVSNINDDNPMVESIGTQTRTMIEIADAEAKRDIVLANESMKLSGKLFSGMGAINENLAHIVNFNSKDGASYINASLRYYEQSITHLTDISSKLSNIEKVLVKEEDPKWSSNRLGWSDVVSSGGGFNISNYLQMVKKNAKTALEGSMFGGMLMPMFEDEDYLKALMQQPLSLIPKMIVQAAIPATLKQTAGMLDTSFKNLIPGLLTRVADMSNDLDDQTGLKELIGTAFGLKAKTRSKVDTSNYEKGPVPFDGVTKKAITEVIPGYLSKIVALLSNEDAQIFDYESGKYIKRRDIKENFEEDRKRSALREFSSVSNIKDNVKKSIGSDTVDKSTLERLNDSVDKYFTYLAEHQYRMKRPEDADSFIKQIMDFTGNDSKEEAEILRQAFLKTKRSDRTAIASIETLAAHDSMKEFYDKLDTSGSSQLSIFNDLYDKKFDKRFDDPYKINKDPNSLFLPKDKHGNSSLNYLRDIKNLLIHGVAVYKVEKKSALSKVNDIVEMSNLREEGYKILTTEEDKQYEIDLKEERKREEERKKKEEEEAKKPKAFDKLVKFITGNDKDRQNTINEFRNKIFAKIVGAADSADQFMYDLVFGKGEDENKQEKKSFLDKLVNGVINPFKKFGGWVKNSFFEPVKNFFFGKDGLAEKIQNSPLFNNTKEQFKNFGNYLFGEKDEKGNRKGGLLGDVGVELVNAKNSIIDFFAGKGEDNKFRDDTVFGNIRIMMTSAFSGVKNTITGKNEKANSLFGEIGSVLKSGVKNFTDIIFGTANSIAGKDAGSIINTDEMIAKVKAGAPKAVAAGITGLGIGAIGAAGGLGLLGSMFLTPVGGAALGIAGSFLSRSEGFKNWLFGEEKDGERIGGVISKSTQNFFKNNKQALATGGTLGAVAGTLGMGVLPSFILGGPVGGAVMGMGVALASKSETLQSFLFGELKDGKRSGGKLSKFFNEHGKMNAETKTKLATVGIGAIGGATLAKFGLIGGMAINPIFGAVAGIGAGLLASSNKFKEALFGKYEDGKKVKFGVMDDLKENFNVNIIQPLKIKFLETSFNIKNWFDESIAEPMMQAFDPIVYEAKTIGKKLWNGVKNVGKSIVDKFMGSAPMKKLTTVFKRLGTALNTIVGTLGKVVGNVVSAPFKFIGAIGRGLAKKQMAAAKKLVTSKAFENLFAPVTNVVSQGFDIVKGLLGDIKSGLKDLATTVFKKWIWEKGIKAGAQWAGKKIKNSKAGKGVASAYNATKDFLFGPGQTDEEALARVEDIMLNRSSKDHEKPREFGEKVRDVLNLTFLPKSKLSVAARQHDIDYLPEWQSGMIKRRDERSIKKEKQRQLIADLKEKNIKNKELLKMRRANVEALSDEDRKIISNEEFNEIIEKSDLFNKKQFKKTYYKGSKATEGEIELARVNHEIAADTNTNVVKATDILQNIFDFLKSSLGIHKNIDTDIGSDTTSTIVDSESDTISDDSTPSNILYTKNGTRRKLKLSRNKKLIGAAATQASIAFASNSDPNTSIPSEEDEMTHIRKNSLGEHSSEIDDENKKEDAILKAAEILGGSSDAFELGETAGEIKKNEERQSFFDSIKGMTDGITKIKEILFGSSDDQKKHNKEWSGIFGPKGLLTLGLITAGGYIISMISKFINPEDGFWGNVGNVIKGIMFGGDKKGEVEKRTDATGDAQENLDSSAALTRATAAAVAAPSKVVKKATKAVTGMSDKELMSKTINHFKGNAVKQTEKVAKSGVDTVVDASTKNIAKSVAEGGDEILKNATKKNGIITWFVKNVDIAVNSFIDFITKKFPKVAKKLAPLTDNLLKASQKVSTGVVKSADDSIIKMISRAMMNAVGDVAYVIPWIGLAIDVVCVVGGAAFGGTTANAANLFNIHKDDVDRTMLTISATFGGLLNWGWFFIFELANALSVMFGGPDFIHDAAVFIYNAIVGDEKEEALKLSQEEMQNSYERYTKTQQIAKGNAVFGDNGQISYKDNKLVESFESYNDRVNKTTGSAVIDFVKDNWLYALGPAGWAVKGAGAIKKTLFGGGDEKIYNEAVDSIKRLEDAAAQDPSLANTKEYKDLMKELTTARDENKPTTGWFGKKKTDTPDAVGGELSPIDLLSQYRVSSNYATRELDGKVESHNGIDLVKETNSPIVSFTSGVVKHVDNSHAADSGSLDVPSSKGFGNYVVVQDDNGKYNYYGHMNGTSVNVGDRVNVGDKLGILGHTGRSTGAHLHYEVRNKMQGGLGRANTVDPTEYLKGNESSFTVSNTPYSSDPSDQYDIMSLFGHSSGGDLAKTFLDQILNIFGASSNTISTDNSSQHNTSSPFTNITANNLKDELMLKTLELTGAHEGQYNSVNRDDNGSYSVGMMQFHGPNAQTMFNRMANADPSIAEQALKYAGWYNRALTENEAKEMKDFLTANEAIAKEVQTKYAKEFILSNNMKTPWDMYSKGELIDPRSVILAADIGNTGAGHLANWRKKYSPAANEGGSDLLHVKNSLQSTDSWWGQQAGKSQYYNGWMNRISSVYNTLTDWAPSHVGGEADVQRGDIFKSSRTNNFGSNITSTIKTLAQNTTNTVDNKIIEVLSNMVTILTEISVNTKSTSDNITKIPSSQSVVTPVVATSQSTNPIYDAVEKQRSNKRSNNYTVAKKIAAGGAY